MPQGKFWDMGNFLFVILNTSYARNYFSIFFILISQETCLSTCFPEMGLHVKILTLQSSLQWVLGALSAGAKWLGCKADQTPPPAEV
jgi:hypothetical protein